MEAGNYGYKDLRYFSNYEGPSPLERNILRQVVDGVQRPRVVAPALLPRVRVDLHLSGPGYFSIREDHNLRSQGITGGGP